MCNSMAIQHDLCEHSQKWVYFCEDVLDDISRAIKHKIIPAGPPNPKVATYECHEDCCRAIEAQEIIPHKATVDQYTNELVQRLLWQVLGWQAIEEARGKIARAEAAIERARGNTRAATAQLQAKKNELRAKEAKYDYNESRRPGRDEANRLLLEPAERKCNAIKAKHYAHRMAWRQANSHNYGGSSGNATRIFFGERRDLYPAVDRLRQGSGSQSSDHSGRERSMANSNARGGRPVSGSPKPAAGPSKH